MRFLFQYPDRNGPDGHLLEAGPIPTIAAAAEAAGWDGFGLTDHPAPGARWLSAGGHQTLDPFVAMAAAGAVTSKIRLLTYLAVLPYRNPLLLAKAAATVDLMSGGRFTLGAGTGYLKGEFRAVGVDFEERNVLFDEALDVLPMHWSGEPFSYQGRHFEAREVMARPAPIQQPIPIWIGGNAAVTLRRVATRAQGWMPLLGSPELFATTRTPAITSASELGSHIGRLQEMAGGRVLDVAVPYVGLAPEDPAVDAARHRDEFATLAAAGVTWVIVGCRSTEEATTLGFIEGFGAAYLR